MDMRSLGLGKAAFQSCKAPLPLDEYQTGILWMSILTLREFLKPNTPVSPVRSEWTTCLKVTTDQVSYCLVGVSPRTNLLDVARKPQK
jgi:hypothetical protein